MSFPGVCMNDDDDHHHHMMMIAFIITLGEIMQ
jgi:hypothetical protein